LFGKNPAAPKFEENGLSFENVLIIAPGAGTPLLLLAKNASKVAPSSRQTKSIIHDTSGKGDPFGNNGRAKFKALTTPGIMIGAGTPSVSQPP
jgi:hypothetical protein